MAVGTEVWKESDGKSIHVDLTATVVAKQVAYVDGWAGITVTGGDSGETVALNIERQEYQVEVPSGLTVNKGDTIYLDTDEVTGHTPNDAAYTTTSSGTTVPFLKATSDKDANDVVTGILIVT
jgi:plastocyanin